VYCRSRVARRALNYSRKNIQKIYEEDEPAKNNKQQEREKTSAKKIK